MLPENAWLISLCLMVSASSSEDAITGPETEDNGGNGGRLRGCVELGRPPPPLSVLRSLPLLLLAAPSLGVKRGDMRGGDEAARLLLPGNWRGEGAGEVRDDIAAAAALGPRRP